MITDGQLEFNQQWAGYSDPGIGNPPDNYSVTPASASEPSLVVSITGGKYANVLAATHRPLQPVFDPAHVFYSFQFTLQTDANAAKLQAHESEASYCFTDEKGVNWYFNNSLQLNQVNPKGEVQAYASPTNVWADTGIIVPLLAANSAYPVKISYMVDMVGHTMSTLALTFLEKVYPLPAQFQKVPGIIKNPKGVGAWAPGIYVQFQEDLAFAGGTVENHYSGVAVNWE